MTELGGGIDPFEFDLLQSSPVCLGPESFAESEHTLLDTGDGALEHDEVVLDFSVSDESSHSV